VTTPAAYEHASCSATTAVNSRASWPTKEAWLAEADGSNQNCDHRFEGRGSVHFDQQQQRDRARRSAGELQRKQRNEHDRDRSEMHRFKRQSCHSHGPIGRRRVAIIRT
jgi:hypothetical protein